MKYALLCFLFYFLFKRKRRVDYVAQNEEEIAAYVKIN
jgi:hypothetical protein